MTDRVLNTLANVRVNAEVMLRIRSLMPRGVPTPIAACIRNPRFNALT